MAFRMLLFRPKNGNLQRGPHVCVMHPYIAVHRYLKDYNTALVNNVQISTSCYWRIKSTSPLEEFTALLSNKAPKFTLPYTSPRTNRRILTKMRVYYPIAELLNTLSNDANTKKWVIWVLLTYTRQKSTYCLHTGLTLLTCDIISFTPISWFSIGLTTFAAMINPSRKQQTAQSTP